MKRKEMCELAGLMKFEKIKEEIQKEKSLERWARRCTNHFPKRVKRMLFGEIDNMIWNGHESEITQWCKRNKVFDEITENEIMEIWMSEEPDDEEAVRLNGKYFRRPQRGCANSSIRTKTSSPSPLLQSIGM